MKLTKAKFTVQSPIKITWEQQLEGEAENEPEDAVDAFLDSIGLNNAFFERAFANQDPKAAAAAIADGLVNGVRRAQSLPPDTLPEPEIEDSEPGSLRESLEEFDRSESGTAH